MKKIGIGVVLISGLVFLLLFIPYGLSSTDGSNMSLGDVDCAVSLTTVGYINGEPTTIANNPFYVGGAPVDALEFRVQLQASGDFVDWSTLQITVDLYVNDLLLTTWTWGTSLNFDAGGFSKTDAHMVDELDFLASGSPDQVLDNGVEVYNIDCTAEAEGVIEDYKGNILSDTLVVRNAWELQTDPNGIFTLHSEAVTKPSFTTIPSDMSVNQGESNILTWRATDDNPTTYEVTTYTPADGSYIQSSGTWSNSTEMQFDVGTFVSLEPGDYVLRVTCKIIDGDEHQTIDSVAINVHVPTVPTGPTIDGSTGPTSFKAGELDQAVTFHAQSSRPASYKIFLNGLEMEAGAWPGGDISYVVPSILAGKNRVKCVVWDTLNQEASHTHYIEGTGEPYTTTTDPFDDFGTHSPWTASLPVISIGVAIGIAILGLIFLRRDQDES
jgi:hypothetical protein